MLLKHALRLFKLGFRVVPITLQCIGDEVEKRPIVKWRKFVEHQSEEDVKLLPWNLANGIAVICGVRIGDKYLCVLDFDDPSAYERVRHILPETYTERTPRGGYHVFLFSRTPPVTKSFRKDNKEIFSILGENKLCVVHPSEGYTIVKDCDIASIPNANALANKIAHELDLLKVEKYDDTPKDKLIKLFEKIKPHLNIAKEYDNYFMCHCPFHPPDEHPSFAIYKNTFLAIDFHDNKVYTLKELAKALGIKVEPEVNLALLETMKVSERAHYLARYLISKMRFAEVIYPDGSNELWYFNDKILRPNAKRIINRELTRLLKGKATTNLVNETERNILGLVDLSFERSELDPQRYLPFRNCALDLETFEVKNYDDLIKQGIAFTSYIDIDLDINLINKIIKGDIKPEEIAPEFDNFLNRFYDRTNKTKLLYGLASMFIPKVMKKKCVLIIGEPNTGKTTLKEVLLTILGDLATSTSIIVLQKTYFSLSKLVGKRLILVSEKPGYLNSELFKQLTGGETLPIDVKHKPLFTAPISATWIFFMNEPPVFNKLDDAVVDRIILVYTKDPLSEDEKDPTIFDRLIVEKDRIIHYLLYYYYLLKSGVLIVEEDNEQVYQTLLKGSSRVFEFLQECCELNENAQVEGKKLYEAYLKWCSEKKANAVSRQTFYRDVEQYLAVNKIGGRITKRNRSVVFRGLMLKFDEEFGNWSLDEVLGD